MPRTCEPPREAAGPGPAGTEFQVRGCCHQRKVACRVGTGQADCGPAGRLSAFSLDDPGSVLDPQAAAEARVLLSLVIHADGGMPLNAALAVAWLYWCRYLALPEGQGQNDLREAIALFSSIAQASPHAVPEPLRKHLPPVGGDTNADWHCDTAVDLLLNDPAALNLAIALLTIALDDTRDDHPNRGMYLNNMTSALLGRFQRAGAVQDLDQAIRAAAGGPGHSR